MRGNAIAIPFTEKDTVIALPLPPETDCYGATTACALMDVNATNRFPKYSTRIERHHMLIKSPHCSISAI